MIPDDALREYLKHTSSFLGYVKAVRFRAFTGGVAAVTAGGSPVYRVTRAMALDYDALAEEYGISLETLAFTPEDEVVKG